VNWDKLKKNIGMRFQIEPPVRSIGGSVATERPQQPDYWTLEAITGPDSLRLKRTSTGHVVGLGKDHIYDFRSDPAGSTGGVPSGYLILKMQIEVDGQTVRLRPNARPGEPVPAPSLAREPEITGKQLSSNESVGQRYRTVIELTVHAAYPPANLSVVVHSNAIESIELVPQSAGMSFYGHSGVRPGFAFTNLQSPSGVLHLQIFTKTPADDLRIEWQFT